MSDYRAWRGGPIKGGTPHTLASVARHGGAILAILKDPPAHGTLPGVSPSGPTRALTSGGSLAMSRVW